MNDIMFELLKLFVMVAVLVIARYVIPWIKRKIGYETLDTAAKWAKSAVLMAQQVFWDKDGAERKAYVTVFLKELLTQKNLDISDEQLDILIEAAVKQMKIEESSGIVIQAVDDVEQDSSGMEAN